MRGGGGQKDPTLPKICHTYPTMMKLDSYTLPIDDAENIRITWQSPWVLLTSAFLPKISKFCYIKKYWYRLHFDTLFPILLTVLEIFFLISLVKILMMSAKMATPSLLEIMVFWNKEYDVIIHVNDVINKILSHDSNYIADVFMWPKFGNSSISVREVITT